MPRGEAESIIAFLTAEGAGEVGHAGGRTLLDHLIGVYWIARRWGQPVWLQRAALIHSVYGTERFRWPLVSDARRGEVAAVAGSRAERLAYLFCATPRAPLFAGTHRWVRDLPVRSIGDPGRSEDTPGEPARAEDAPTEDELDALVLLHMANLAEQARAKDGSPGRWLVRLRDLAELLVDSDTVTLPLFIAELAGLRGEDESLARRAYTEGMAGEGESRSAALALAAATCPVVPEPCAWLSYVALRRGDEAMSRSWAAQARKRLLALGTVWDKRLSYEEWLAVIEGLERAPAPRAEDGAPAPRAEERMPAPRAEEGAAAPRAEDRAPAPRAEKPVTDPRVLLESVAREEVSPSGSSDRRGEIAPPDAEAGSRRFQRYLDGLADADAPTSGAVYPDLPSRPWHEPGGFALVGYLESHYGEIRDEILGLDPALFHRESERIGRTGDWDVVFFYERGRRHHDVCAACPVTTRGIETPETIRTLGGLIYVSRLRPGTDISPHRGPTNLRVRCHLGIEVPSGDCAIRVGEETRQWREGACLVFDDYFPHEAWNHTEEDRIVLIVDLWHPALSAAEVRRLEALQGYAYFHAQRLGRYWSANAAARGDGL